MISRQTETTQNNSPFLKRMLEARLKFLGAEETEAPGEISRWEIIGVFILMLLAALAAEFSTQLCNLHDGDSLLPSIMSLQKVTPFYWGQNRFGNLLPFLAQGIRDITANFEFQVYLRALGTASMPLLVLVFLGVRRHLLSAYALGLALMLLPFAPQGNYWCWIDAEPYGPSALLLLIAISLHGANPFRKDLKSAVLLAATLLFTCLVFYVNGGLVLLALPLWTVLSVAYPNRRNWSFLAMIVVAFGVCTLLGSRYGREYHEAYDYSRFSFGWKNFSDATASIGAVTSWTLYGAYGVVTLCGLTAAQYFHGRNRKGEGPVLAPVVVKGGLLFVLTLFYLGLFVNMEWVRLNYFAFRYFIFGLLVFPTLCAVAATGGLTAWQPTEKRAGVYLGVIGFVLLAVAVFCRLAPFEMTPPFVEKAHRKNALALAAIAKNYNASFVTGDYYLTWPVVFDTIRLGQLKGDEKPAMIFGLAAKGETMRSEIAAYLCASKRVVLIGVGMNAEESYTKALRYDAVNWPAHGSLLKSGAMPDGGVYSVLLFEKKPEAHAGVEMAPQAEQLFSMMKPVPPLARWNGKTITVQPDGKPAVAVRGPGVNLVSGTYRVAFQVQAAGASTGPLLEIEICDRFGTRIYTRTTVRSDAMENRDGDTWASAEFTVPENQATQNLEFRVYPAGNMPFVINGMELASKNP